MREHRGSKTGKPCRYQENVDCYIQIFHMAGSNKRLVGSKFMNDLEGRRTNGHDNVPVGRRSRKLAAREASALECAALQMRPHWLLFRSTFKPHHPPNIIVIGTRRPATDLDATRTILYRCMHACRAHGASATGEFVR